MATARHGWVAQRLAAAFEMDVADVRSWLQTRDVSKDFLALFNGSGEPKLFVYKSEDVSASHRSPHFVINSSHESGSCADRAP